MSLFNYETNFYLIGYLLLAFTVQRDDILDSTFGINKSKFFINRFILCPNLCFYLNFLHAHLYKNCIIHSEPCLIRLYIHFRCENEMFQLFQGLPFS